MRIESFHQNIRWDFEDYIGHEEDSERNVWLLARQAEISGQTHCESIGYIDSIDSWYCPFERGVSTYRSRKATMYTTNNIGITRKSVFRNSLASSMCGCRGDSTTGIEWELKEAPGRFSCSSFRSAIVSMHVHEDKIQIHAQRRGQRN